MSRPIIVVGDWLDHGGKVVSGSGSTDIDGRAVARVGDKAVCNRHGITSIVSGDTSTIIDGYAVARHGDRTACGATLFSSQFRVFVDAGGDHWAAARMPKSSLTVERTTALGSRAPYDRFFAIRDQVTGAPAVGVPYRITLESGAVFEGITDSQGLTKAAFSATPEIATIDVADYAKDASDDIESFTCTGGESCEC